MARSNAASRDSAGGARMLRSTAALIGDFASSATAPGAHEPTRTSAPARATMLVIDDERMERVLLQLVAAVEKREFDHERHAHDVATELIDQSQRCRHRAAGCEQVVHGEHALPGLDRILVDRERVAAILELVLHLDGLARELAELANGNESRVQLMGERAADDEASRLDSDHHVDSLVLVPAYERVDDVPKRRTVLQERGDVLKEDSLGREVLDVADFRLQIGDVHRPISYPRCRGAQGSQSVRSGGTVTPATGGNVRRLASRCRASIGSRPRIFGRNLRCWPTWHSTCCLYRGGVS